MFPCVICSRYMEIHNNKMFYVTKCNYVSSNQDKTFSTIPT